MTPTHPVYIISKGRWEAHATARHLDAMRVPYVIVVEPQEADRYRAVIRADRVLVLPFANLGQGSIPARNWVWSHALARGARWHWILDDNIQGFFRFNRNLKIPVRTGTIFAAAETFVERYANIAQAGFNYKAFMVRTSGAYPPFYLNTRIYSCILLRTSLPHRWRGRYNEDTDLSLRLLKDGWCTVLFNCFLCEKGQTMSQKGGNTDELYAGDGRLKMAESLVAQHPDLVTITTKWGRPQHHVDYRPFRKTRLQRARDVVVPVGVDEFDMRLEAQIGDTWQSIAADDARRYARHIPVNNEE